MTALLYPTLRLIHRIGDSFSRRLSELLGEKVVWEFQFQVAPPNRAQHVRPALTRLATCKVSRRPSVVAQKRESERGLVPTSLARSSNVGAAAFPPLSLSLSLSPTFFILSLVEFGLSLLRAAAAANCRCVHA